MYLNRLFIFILFKNIDQDVILFTLECSSGHLHAVRKKLKMPRQHRLHNPTATTARFSRNDRTIQPQ